MRRDVVRFFFLRKVCFFFLAEDGIRHLVRSRGLGNVYRRQHQRQQRISLLADRQKNERCSATYTCTPCTHLMLL